MSSTGVALECLGNIGSTEPQHEEVKPTASESATIIVTVAAIQKDFDGSVIGGGVTEGGMQAEHVSRFMQERRAHQDAKVGLQARL